MNNFEYYCPTRVVFGRGSIAELDRLLPADGLVMLTYGGGSIKRNGVHDQVLRALGGRDFIEFGGIPANPTYEVCMRAVEIARREEVTFLLAVGGGSVLDGTKFMAAAIPFTAADPWQFMAQRGVVMPESAVPIGAVLTLPATGSEMNAFSVMSRESTNEKLAFSSELVQPRFSILDPETTFSLPKKQVRNGVVDAFVHDIEQYLTHPLNTPLQDRQAEAILLTLLEEGPKTLANLTDYDARANLMWCATGALNGHLACGVAQDWATHLIGHELTALYGVAHAESLAMVLPARWRCDLERKRAMLTQFAQRVWGFDGPENEAPAAAIAATVEFFHSLGMPTRLSDYDISADQAAQRIHARFTQRGTALGEYSDIDADAAAEIIRNCA